MTPSQRNTARMVIASATIAIGGTLERLQNLYTPQQSAPAWLLMGSGTAEILVGIAFLFVVVTFHHLISAQTFFAEKSMLGTVLAVVAWPLLGMNGHTGSLANTSMVAFVDITQPALLS